MNNGTNAGAFYFNADNASGNANSNIGGQAVTFCNKPVSVASYFGWLQHGDSFRLLAKYAGGTV